MIWKIALALSIAMLMSAASEYSYHWQMLKASQRAALLNVKVIYASPQYASTTTAKHLLLVQLKY